MSPTPPFTLTSAVCSAIQAGTHGGRHGRRHWQGPVAYGT